MNWQRWIFPVFFTSGALALIYQMAWVRALTLEFGSTTLAVATVVAVFLAGLGIGAKLAGDRADHWRRPLGVYALLELGVAFWGLTSLLFIHFLLPLFSGLASSLGGGFWTVSLVRLLLAMVMLLPPTILMGAGLPVLARFYVRMQGEGRRGSGLLYGINTLGAFLGVLLGGLYFLPVHGLVQTIVIVSALNTLLAAVAWVGFRQTEVPETGSASHVSQREGRRVSGEESVMVRLWMPMAIALTAFAALVCQVAWVRVMELVLGASVFAVTIVLGLFLAGLGLGAFAVAALLRHGQLFARAVFIILALLSALAILASTWLFQYLPELYVQLHSAWSIAQVPGRVLQLQFLIAALVVFLPTVFLGGLFPASLQVVIAHNAQTSRHTGRLFAWDTVGSIAGSVTAGFLLIPLLGIDNSLRTAMLLLVLAAGVLALAGRERRLLRAVALPGFLLLMIGTLLMPAWDRALMTSAVYQYSSAYLQHGAENLASHLRGQSEVIYYRDGLTSTVTVLEGRGGDGEWRAIAVNGKIEGSSESDMPSQRLIAHIPLLMRPVTESVAVIGMGTGSTAAAVATHPVKTVDVVEIEAAMVEGARLFHDVNAQVHENERVTLHVTDGRLFLNMHPDRYDLIISQPSNPWMAGASDLFTREAFQRGARALREGGVFAQWVQIYNLSPQNLTLLLRGFSDVFPHVYVFKTLEDSDLLLLGAFEEITMDMAAMRQRLQQPAVARDLQGHYTQTDDVFDVAGRLILGPDDVPLLVGTGEFHSDDRPLIAYRAPFNLFMNTRQVNKQLLANHAGNPLRYLTGLPEGEDERREWLQKLREACETRVGIYELCLHYRPGRSMGNELNSTSPDLP
ncbi:fused MFS/spermidine synthase [Natronospira bacteriovora]|uniref:Polyamine aminopropyltransferase n=1 Tax=Natronospira bacteriovora TaxID=3069753 RepID=A0ABU0W463_9GAMM|nr:fused MFS/spermidine synthase [Natronospira sp. AB-CW4]MDQ2068810.1 fused MFS/spermidine synthase [Natronospira sp. AB-CW4]